MVQNVQRLVAAGLVLVASGPLAALAQQPLAGPSPSTCQQPAENPPDQKSGSMTKFNQQIEDYKVCIGSYAKGNGAKAEEYAAQAHAYTDAANKAIDDYNQYIARVSAANESANAAAKKK